MKPLPIIFLVMLTIAITVGLYTFWPSLTHDGQTHPAAGTRPTLAADQPLRLGLVPEHDVFALRRSYQDLTKYLSRKLGRRVEVVTLSTYQAVLADFQEHQIDGAFLGSLVALLAIDRYDAKVLLKPEQSEGVSTYRGVIFVRDDSPVQSLDQLAGRSIGMLRATYAGSLFPIAELSKRNLLQGPSAPRIIWMGTHDEVIDAVASGRAEVGAVKDLRLAAYEKNHPGLKLRRLATSKPVPNNALVMRRDVAEQLGQQITTLLQNMENEPDGRAALANIGAKRFIPCSRDEYAPIFQLIDPIGPAWTLIGIDGQPPKRPETR